MDITLEKIELVKDRTAVSYKEAKDALEAAGGSVVDAIISIEEDIDRKIESGIDGKGNAIVDAIKSVIAKGNATRIQVSNKDDEVILNIPITAGIVGAAISPLLAIVSSVAAFGTKCVIEVVTDEGDVIDISTKVDSAVNKAMEKGSEVYGNVKNSETMEKVVDQAGDFFEKTTDTVMKKIRKADDFDFAEDIDIDLEDPDEVEGKL